MNFIFDLHQTMMSQKLILVYQGDFTQETTKSILTMAERSLEGSEEDPALKRKVFNVMVEALQNIVKHNEPWTEATGAHPAIFLIGREPNRYTVMCGNPVSKARVPMLKETLGRINALDKEGLKDLYKKIIQDATISDKGGAGLGFVDMARKSGEKLWFDFPEMSGAYCFFCLKVKVLRELRD
jgi:hypothetical protein